MDRFKRKSALKLMSLALIFSFLAQDISWGASATLFSVKSPAISPVSIHIPDHLGRARDVFRGEDPRLLILIQDAHTNYSAQKNIAAILEELAAKKGLKHVYVEGGTRDDSLAFLKPLAGPEQRKRVADHFLLKGEISGPEYLTLASDAALELTGVETLPVYMKNLKQYAELSENREAIVSGLDEIRKVVASLKNAMFVPSIAVLDNFLEAYRSGNESFTDYHKRLSTAAKESSVNMTGYPHFMALDKVRDLESKIDFKKANRQQAELVRELKARGMEPAILTDTEKIHRSHETLLAHYAELFRLAEGAGIPVAQYDEVRKYEDYVRTFDALRTDELLIEAEKIEEAVYAKALGSTDAMRLHEIDRYITGSKDLFSLQATRSQFESFAARFGDERFHTVSILAFLNRQLLALGRDSEVLTYSDLLEGTKKQITEFYGTTAERDQVMVSRTLEAMRRDRAQLGVLVAGGYHSENLKSLLRAEHVSYVVISPNVSAETNLKKYEEVLLSGLNIALDKPALLINAAANDKQVTPLAAVERAMVPLIRAELSPNSELPTPISAGARLASMQKTPTEEMPKMTKLQTLLGFRAEWTLANGQKVLVRIGTPKNLERVMWVQENSPADKELRLKTSEVQELLKRKQVLVVEGVLEGKTQIVGAIFTHVSHGQTKYADVKNPKKNFKIRPGSVLYDFWIINPTLVKPIKEAFPGLPYVLIMSSAAKAGKRQVIAYSRPGGVGAFYEKTLWAEMQPSQVTNLLRVMKRDHDYVSKLMLRYMLHVFVPGEDPRRGGSTKPFLNWLAEKYQITPASETVFAKKLNEVLNPKSQEESFWKPSKDGEFQRLIGLLLRQMADETGIYPIDATLGWALHMKYGAHFEKFLILSRPEDNGAFWSNALMSYTQPKDMALEIKRLLKEQEKQDPTTITGARLAEDIEEFYDATGRLTGATLKTDRGETVHAERADPSLEATGVFMMKFNVEGKRADEPVNVNGEVFPGIEWQESPAQGGRPGRLLLTSVYLDQASQKNGIGRAFFRWLRLRAVKQNMRLGFNTTWNPAVAYLMLSSISSESVRIRRTGDNNRSAVTPPTFFQLLDEAYRGTQRLPFAVSIEGLPLKADPRTGSDALRRFMEYFEEQIAVIRGILGSNNGTVRVSAEDAQRLENITRGVDRALSKYLAATRISAAERDAMEDIFRNRLGAPLNQLNEHRLGRVDQEQLNLVFEELFQAFDDLKKIVEARRADELIRWRSYGAKFDLTGFSEGPARPSGAPARPAGGRLAASTLREKTHFHSWVPLAERNTLMSVIARFLDAEQIKDKTFDQVQVTYKAGMDADQLSSLMDPETRAAFFKYTIGRKTKYFYRDTEPVEPKQALAMLNVIKRIGFKDADELAAQWTVAGMSMYAKLKTLFDHRMQAVYVQALVADGKDPKAPVQDYLVRISRDGAKPFTFEVRVKRDEETGRKRETYFVRGGTFVRGWHEFGSRWVSSRAQKITREQGHIIASRIRLMKRYQEHLERINDALRDIAVIRSLARDAASAKRKAIVAMLGVLIEEIRQEVKDKEPEVSRIADTMERALLTTNDGERAIEWTGTSIKRREVILADLLSAWTTLQSEPDELQVNKVRKHLSDSAAGYDREIVRLNQIIIKRTRVWFERSAAGARLAEKQKRSPTEAENESLLRAIDKALKQLAEGTVYRVTTKTLLGMAGLSPTLYLKSVVLTSEMEAALTRFREIERTYIDDHIVKKLKEADDQGDTRTQPRDLTEITGTDPQLFFERIKENPEVVGKAVNDYRAGVGRRLDPVITRAAYRLLEKVRNGDIEFITEIMIAREAGMGIDLFNTRKNGEAVWAAVSYVKKWRTVDFKIVDYVNEQLAKLAQKPDFGITRQMIQTYAQLTPMEMTGRLRANDVVRTIYEKALRESEPDARIIRASKDMVNRLKAGEKFIPSAEMFAAETGLSLSTFRAKRRNPEAKEAYDSLVGIRGIWLRLSIALDILEQRMDDHEIFEVTDGMITEQASISPKTLNNYIYPDNPEHRDLWLKRQKLQKYHENPNRVLFALDQLEESEGVTQESLSYRTIARLAGMKNRELVTAVMSAYPEIKARFNQFRRGLPESEPAIDQNLRIALDQMIRFGIRPLSVENLAARSGYSPRYLRNWLKRPSGEKLRKSLDWEVRSSFAEETIPHRTKANEKMTEEVNELLADPERRGALAAGLGRSNGHISRITVFDDKAEVGIRIALPWKTYRVLLEFEDGSTAIVTFKTSARVSPGHAKIQREHVIDDRIKHSEGNLLQKKFLFGTHQIDSVPVVYEFVEWLPEVDPRVRNDALLAEKLMRFWVASSDLTRGRYLPVTDQGAFYAFFYNRSKAIDLRFTRFDAVEKIPSMEGMMSVVKGLVKNNDAVQYARIKVFGPASEDTPSYVSPDMYIQMIQGKDLSEDELLSRLGRSMELGGVWIYDGREVHAVSRIEADHIIKYGETRISRQSLKQYDFVPVGEYKAFLNSLTDEIKERRVIVDFIPNGMPIRETGLVESYDAQKGLLTVIYVQGRSEVLKRTEVVLPKVAGLRLQPFGLWPNMQSQKFRMENIYTLLEARNPASPDGLWTVTDLARTLGVNRLTIRKDVSLIREEDGSTANLVEDSRPSQFGAPVSPSEASVGQFYPSALGAPLPPVEMNVHKGGKFEFAKTRFFVGVGFSRERVRIQPSIVNGAQSNRYYDVYVPRLGDMKIAILDVQAKTDRSKILAFVRKTDKDGYFEINSAEYKVEHVHRHKTAYIVSVDPERWTGEFKVFIEGREVPFRSNNRDAQGSRLAKASSLALALPRLYEIRYRAEDLVTHLDPASAKELARKIHQTATMVRSVNDPNRLNKDTLIRVLRRQAMSLDRAIDTGIPTVLTEALVNLLQVVADIELIKNFGQEDSLGLYAMSSGMFDMSSILTDDRAAKQMSASALSGGLSGARLATSRGTDHKGRFEFEGTRYNLGAWAGNDTVVLRPQRFPSDPLRLNVILGHTKVAEISPAEGRIWMRAYYRKTDAKGLLFFGSRRYNLTTRFAGKPVRLLPVLNESRDMERLDVVIRGKKIAELDAVTGNMRLLVRIKKTDAKGRFNFKGIRYGLGTGYKDRMITLTPLDAEDWDRGFKVVADDQEVEYWVAGVSGSGARLAVLYPFVSKDGTSVQAMGDIKNSAKAIEVTRHIREELEKGRAVEVIEHGVVWDQGVSRLTFEPGAVINGYRDWWKERGDISVTPVGLYADYLAEWTKAGKEIKVLVLPPSHHRVVASVRSVDLASGTVRLVVTPEDYRATNVEMGDPEDFQLSVLRKTVRESGILGQPVPLYQIIKIFIADEPAPKPAVSEPVAVKPAAKAPPKTATAVPSQAAKFYSTGSLRAHSADRLTETRDLDTVMQRIREFYADKQSSTGVLIRIFHPKTGEPSKKSMSVFSFRGGESPDLDELRAYLGIFAKGYRFTFLYAAKLDEPMMTVSIESDPSKATRGARLARSSKIDGDPVAVIQNYLRANQAAGYKVVFDLPNPGREEITDMNDTRISSILGPMLSKGYTFYRNDQEFMQTMIVTALPPGDSGARLADDTQTISGALTEDLFREVLKRSAYIDESFESLDRDAGLIVKALREDLPIGFKADAVEWLNAGFERQERVYVIGRMRGGPSLVPLVIALERKPTGLAVDTVLTRDASIDRFFDSTYSPFKVSVEISESMVDFLSETLSRLPRSEIYGFLGMEDAQKSRFLSELTTHLETSQAKFKFTKSPGRSGTVLIDFTLDDFPYVFKLVRDKPSKRDAKTKDRIFEIYNKFHFADRHGSALDPLILEDVTLEKGTFDDTLMDRLMRDAQNSVAFGPGSLKFDRLIVQKKTQPLDIFMNDPDIPDPAKERAFAAYGEAVTRLSEADLYPGDIVLHNFGVTPDGRVVAFDYDEYDPITSFRFREIDWQVLDENDDIDPKKVGPMDMFPETYPPFIFSGNARAYRRLFDEAYPNFFKASYWTRIQDGLRAGAAPATLPYEDTDRFFRRFAVARPSPVSNAGARLAAGKEYGPQPDLNGGNIWAHNIVDISNLKGHVAIAQANMGRSRRIGQTPVGMTLSRVAALLDSKESMSLDDLRTAKEWMLNAVGILERDGMRRAADELQQAIDMIVMVEPPGEFVVYDRSPRATMNGPDDGHLVDPLGARLAGEGEGRDIGSIGGRLAAALKPSQNLRVPVLISALTVLFSLTPAEAGTADVSATSIEDLTALTGKNVYSGNVNYRQAAAVNSAASKSGIGQEALSALKMATMEMKAVLPEVLLEGETPVGFELSLDVFSEISEADTEYFRAQADLLVSSFIAFHRGSAYGRRTSLYLTSSEDLSGARLSILQAQIAPASAFIHLDTAPKDKQTTVRFIDTGNVENQVSEDGTIHLPVGRISRDDLVGWSRRFYLALASSRILSKNGRFEPAQLKVEDVTDGLVDGFNLESAEKADKPTLFAVTSGKADFATLVRYKLVAIRKIGIDAFLKVYRTVQKSLGSAA